MNLRRTACVALAVIGLGGLSTARLASGGPVTKVPDAEYPAEFRAGVRKAIEQGVNYLRTKQIDEHALPSEPLPGNLRERLDDIDYSEAAAVTWVLRRAGVPADDPAFAKASKTLHLRAPKDVEEAALVVLAMAAQSLPQGNPFALVDSPKDAAAAPVLSKDDRALMEAATKFILGKQVKGARIGSSADRETDDSGGWGADLGPNAKYVGSDLPTTYLALLGLEAAARSGVAVPAKAFLDASDLLVGWQAQKGPATVLKMNAVRGSERAEWTEKAQARGFGWAGLLSDSPSGYETVGGAIGLIACQDALQKDRTFSKVLKQKTRVGIRDALAWLQQNYDITKNPSTGKARSGIEGPLFHHHWLQGLARLEIHARMRYVGTHDWYQEGADVLVKTQNADGSWEAIWWANCYALLFLMRASLTSIVPVVTESEPGR